MPERADRTGALTGARVHLFEDADPALPGVPGHVAASWRRSVARGVDPGALTHSYCPDLDLGSRLIRCAQPVIEQLAEEIADAPMCVALTDDRARLLIRRDSDSRIGRALDHVSFARGFGYAEETVGTNGVGTVLECGTSVHIVGAEHFVEPLQAFACAGAPIRDPFTGRIDGVLDISCRSQDSTPLMLSLVRSAAARIERNLLLDRDRVQQALFELYARVDARGHDAVLAVGRRVVLANTAMQTLLEPADRRALEDHLRFAMTRPAGPDDRLVLPSGTPVRVRRSTVSAGGDVAGVVGVVRLLDHAPPAGAPPRGPRPLGAATRPAADEVASSPAWRAAAATVEEALRDGVPVVVLGEPGAGRATLLADTYRRVHPAGRVVLVAADEGEATPDAVADRLLRAGPDAALHVLRDIDRLSPPSAQLLLDRLGGGARPVRGLAGTAGPGGAAPSPLLAAFAASAPVPPLRHRSGDTPAIVRDLLTELAPHRTIRLDDQAMRLVVRYRWPGNVPQLREALAAALRVRPVGCIQAQDLPAYCSSVPRTALRRVDEAERDAIVTALRATGGNRVAAATVLGLARSTLYRKIAHYGISG